MSKPAKFLFGMLIACSTSAQEFISCDGTVQVNSNSPSGRTIHTRVPETFEELGAQQDFGFVLTTEWNAITMAEFRADLTPDQAVNLAASTLEGIGWRVLSIPVRGFRLNGQEPVSVLCEGQDIVTLYSRVTESGVCLTARSQDIGDGTCIAGGGFPAQMEPHDARRFAPLLLPAASQDEFAVEESSAIGTQGGDARRANFGASIETEWPLVRILDHYHEQLLEQGWRRDSTWRAQAAGGSVWSRREVDLGGALGLLDIIHLGGRSFHATFRVVVPE